MATGSDVFTLNDLIQGRRIFIPPIQRDYAWNVGNPETKPLSSQSTKFFQDLINFHRQRIRNEVRKYFLGNIISVVDGDGDIHSRNVAWHLLDGQQRITSFSLLMKAFHYRLDTMNTPLARELQGRLEQVCLSLDQNRFEDEQHPYPLYHRRPNDRRCFIEFNRGNTLQVGRDLKMGNVALTYYDLVQEFETAREIGMILESILDHVLVSVTLTDDMTMGFQMFVTANATGLPLTSYDMFRAFVVKKIETGLDDITPAWSRLLHHQLDNLESIFQANSWGRDEKHKDKNLKSFMAAYMSMRVGRNLRENSIIAAIEREINDFTTKETLQDCMLDMHEHALLWRSEIIGTIVDRTTYLYKFKRRMNRFGVTKVQGSYLSFVNNRAVGEAEWLLKVVEWAVIKQLLRHGQLGGKTEIFSNLATAMNTFWDLEVDITIDDFMAFKEEWLVERIPGDELEQASQRFDEKRYCIYALLHRIENETGLANEDPGRNSRTTSLIPLASEEMAGDYYEHIGNWYLVQGSDNNGLNTTAVNFHIESEEMNLRLETILDHASDVGHNKIDELQGMDENSPFMDFIDRRTESIMTRLNQKYLEFMETDPPI
jgi:hypothetical protein